jgi:hypothetical protein
MNPYIVPRTAPVPAYVQIEVTPDLEDLISLNPAVFALEDIAVSEDQSLGAPAEAK